MSYRYIKPHCWCRTKPEEYITVSKLLNITVNDFACKVSSWMKWIWKHSQYDALKERCPIKQNCLEYVKCYNVVAVFRTKTSCLSHHVLISPISLNLLSVISCYSLSAAFYFHEHTQFHCSHFIIFPLLVSENRWL